MAEIKGNIGEKSGALRRLSLKEYRQATETPPVGVPTDTTVDRLWPVLDQIGGLDALLPPFPKRTHLAEPEWAALVLTVRQAAVVAVDTVILAGEHHALLTKNRVFDALAARWSPAFRRADATCVWDMKPATVERSWRELLARGINFNQLWKLVSQSQTLYQTWQVGRRGYQIRLHDGAEAWAVIVARDPDYRRPKLSARLRLANDPLPSRVFDSYGRCVVRYETAGEWRYNLIEIGKASKSTLRSLEGARVTFDVEAFRKHLAQCRPRALRLPPVVLDFWTSAYQAIDD